MFLKRLLLFNFRNYKETNISLSPGINLIYGKNGAGKTNLLEALYLLSTGRSFRTPHLRELIREQSPHFYIEAHFVKDDIPQTLSIGFNQKSRKIQHNHTFLSNFSHLLGIIPSVLYTPRDSEIIAGPPLERRRFLNIQLSQKNPLYVHHLIRYHRAMKQRNTLLKAKSDKGIKSFETMMATSSTYLMAKRAHLISELKNEVHVFGKNLSKGKDLFDLFYTPSISLKHLTHLETLFEKQRAKEKIFGSTLIGPHRDDFLINYHNKEAKSYASEGQKRTCIAALRLAETSLLKKKALFAIDDFGIHLDPHRSEFLFEELKKHPQVLITLPTDRLPSFAYLYPHIHIEEGDIKA